MKTTELLKREHRAIEIVLTAMERSADALDAGRDIDPALIERLLDFARVFADKCHHSKEEDALFPVLESRGIPRERGPIGVMLAEHDEGRGYLNAIQDNVQLYRQDRAPARAALAEALRSYSALLRAHIRKEDSILFAAADAALTPEDDEDLIKIFDDIEESKIGAGVHEEYHRMLEDLDARMDELTAGTPPREPPNPDPT